MNRKSATGRRGRFPALGVGLVLLAGLLLAGCAHTAPGDTRSPGVAKVRFSYAGPARTVCVSGEFNGWSETAHCLERRGGVWEIEVRIPPGAYAYGFLVDGRVWRHDPHALFTEEDAFGRKNSILVVE